MTTAAAQGHSIDDARRIASRIPWPLYPLAPFVLIPGILLVLWLLPALAFAALTVRRAIKIQSNLWAVAYASLFALIFVASFAWPFALMYLLSELL